jgi:hypothetical protein
MSVLEAQHTERETDHQGYQHEARGCGDCPHRSPQFCSDTDRDADDVRPGHELAKAQDVGEFLLAYPPVLFDGEATGPDESATKSTERDFEKCDEQRSERNAHHKFLPSGMPDMRAPAWWLAATLLQSPMERCISGIPAAERQAIGLKARALVLILSGFLAMRSEHADAFRPFDGTDAAVVGTGELEFELEPVGLLRQGADHTLIAPAVTLNLGLAEAWEAVLEGQGEPALPPASARTSLVGNGAFLKGVIREGVLQDKPGPSIATEFGVLLPGINDESGLDGSWAGIVSDRFGPATVHLTAELAVTRQSRGEIFLSTIVEGPYEWKVRPVAELAYDREAGRRKTSSALVGAIWQIGDNIALDFGVRQGRTNNLGITEIHAGLTYALPLWQAGRE